MTYFVHQLQCTTTCPIIILDLEHLIDYILYSLPTIVAGCAPGQGYDVWALLWGNEKQECCKCMKKSYKSHLSWTLLMIHSSVNFMGKLPTWPPFVSLQHPLISVSSNGWSHCMTRKVLSMMVIGRSEVYWLVDLGFLEGGFRFRWITAIRIVTLCQARQNIVKALYVYADAVKFLELRSLRSHLLAFQAFYSKHWSCGHRVCRACFGAPVWYQS